MTSGITLALGDGPIMDYRRWAEQFYVDVGSAAVASEARPRHA